MQPLSGPTPSRFSGAEEVEVKDVAILERKVLIGRHEVSNSGGMAVIARFADQACGSMMLMSLPRYLGRELRFRFGLIKATMAAAKRILCVSPTGDAPRC